MTPQEFRAAAKEWCATINSEAWICATIYTGKVWDAEPVRLSLHDAIPSECVHAKGDDFPSAFDALRVKYAEDSAALRVKALAKAKATVAALEAAQ